MIDLKQIMEKLEGEYSDHTLRGYRSDMEQFMLWCEQRGVHPLPEPPPGGNNGQTGGGRIAPVFRNGHAPATMDCRG